MKYSENEVFKSALVPGSLEQARSIITNIGNPSIHDNDMGAVIREWIAADKANGLVCEACGHEHYQLCEVVVSPEGDICCCDAYMYVASDKPKEAK